MNGEDSFEAVQYIPVLKTDFIMKSTLDKELCNTLIELEGHCALSTESFSKG